MADYADALRIFNETVATLSGVANTQHVQTLSEIDAIQAASLDPSDMGAYNLTMYGMNSVHQAQGAVVNSVGNANNYDFGSLSATPIPLQVEHTSISSSITGSLGGSENLFTHMVANSANLLPTNNPMMWLVLGAFGLILGKFLILRR